MAPIGNVLIISEPELRSEARWVRTQLEQHGSYQFAEVKPTQLMGSTLLIEQKFVAIVFVSYRLDTGELNFLRKISNEANHAPVLIFTAQISVPTYGQIHAMENMVAVQSPCEPKVFQGLFEKAISSNTTSFAVCPRFITNEPIRVVVLRTGLLLPTRMRNYSATGAFLEYKGISVKVGDKLRISLGDGGSKKDTHLTVEAKVIWIRDGENSRSPARGVGVQFNWESVA